MKFSTYPTINFTFNYFEQLTIEEQLKIIIGADIFIGMHGAGLTYTMFLHSKRALIELATPAWQTQIHFELIASMNTIMYRRCIITNGSPTTAQTIFSCIMEMVFKMCPSLATKSTNISTNSTIVGNISNSSHVKR